MHSADPVQEVLGRLRADRQSDAGQCAASSATNDDLQVGPVAGRGQGLSTLVAPEPAKQAQAGGSRDEKRRTPAFHPAIGKRAGQMPKKYRQAYLRAAAGQASPRAAIKAFCLECVSWERKEVRLCLAVACPLWKYRPFKSGGGQEGGPDDAQ